MQTMMMTFIHKNQTNQQKQENHQQKVVFYPRHLMQTILMTFIHKNQVYQANQSKKRLIMMIFMTYPITHQHVQVVKKLIQQNLFKQPNHLLAIFQARN